jgi:hypothetical protein
LRANSFAFCSTSENSKGLAGALSAGGVTGALGAGTWGGGGAGLPGSAKASLKNKGHKKTTIQLRKLTVCFSSETQ